MMLLIDTSAEQASLALANEGKILFTEENPLPKEHAAWLHPAIRRILESGRIKIEQLKAVAVSAGPGSYTGLRVGMAAAKGICFALKIPLITVNTLRLMGQAMLPLAKENNALICPLIDARRQEVFTAIYSLEMQEILAPQALILDKTSFEEYLTRSRLIFSGSGSQKWEGLTHSPNALFSTQINVTEVFARISHTYFMEKKWSDPIYSEPLYLKEFYTHAKI